MLGVEYIEVQIDKLNKDWYKMKIRDKYTKSLE